jgi:hypothetical protein
VAASAAKIAEVLAGLRAGTARLGSAAALAGVTRQPFGCPAVDALVGGGLPRGRLSELSGPRSSGRMSAALLLLGSAQAAGELVALVDVADALDARTARAAGLRLDRLLWVRPRGMADGLRALDLVLDAGGFGLVVLYACGVPPERRAAGDAVWVRLTRRAEQAKSAVLLVGDRPVAGTFAAVSLGMARGRARFSGADKGPHLFDGIDGRVQLVRSRLGPAEGAAELVLRVAG